MAATPRVLALLAAVLVAPAAVPRRPATVPSPPRVTVAEGTLEGAVDSASGVIVFRGVPYAAPPTGRLRWRPPQPAAHWRGVRSATALGHNCMQTRVYSDIDAFAAGVSEDCLYLNVWTSSLGGAAPAAGRPVMVWIHGGGFFAGFGGEERHDGARLAQKGAVVVTVNYRLGPLGFLAHPALAAESPHHASGNYGLMDQMAALRWVRRNAARFGGDPSRITVFGESAGGMSVGTLVASPLAKGLFQRAILESGTGIGIGVQRRDSAEARGERYAAVLGVTGRGAKAAAALRALSADTLLAGMAMAAKRDSSGRGSGLSFSPVVDGWVLPHPVDSAIARGAANVVPVIVGSNADEPGEVFGAPSRSFARLITARRGGRAYLYQFTRAGEDSASRARGAYHSAEITFVFGRPRPLLENAGHAAYDSTLAEAMSDYWVSFATSGDPNGPPNAGRLPAWPAYDSATDSYLELGPTVVAKQGLRKAQYDSLDVVGRGRGEIRP
ncbi:MAG TPA: carboxylesterase family protein [Gemmatimonadaceae bacterium]|nr:carboxylesterase family protein [Gemmatimonadaceae bacterium]